MSRTRRQSEYARAFAEISGACGRESGKAAREGENDRAVDGLAFDENNLKPRGRTFRLKKYRAYRPLVISTVTRREKRDLTLHSESCAVAHAHRTRTPWTRPRRDDDDAEVAVSERAVCAITSPRTNSTEPRGRGRSRSFDDLRGLSVVLRMTVTGLSSLLHHPRDARRSCLGTVRA